MGDTTKIVLVPVNPHEIPRKEEEERIGVSSQENIEGNEKDKKNKPRATVLETVVYQQPGEPTESITSRFHVYGESPEQPYKRQIKVSQEWLPIDTGWLDNQVGMLVIFNEKIQPNRVLSKEEQDFLNSKIVDIAVIGISDNTPKNQRTMFSETQVVTLTPLLFILPGESQRLRVLDPSLLRIMCRNDTTKIKIHCYPK